MVSYFWRVAPWLHVVVRGAKCIPRNYNSAKKCWAPLPLLLGTFFTSTWTKESVGSPGFHLFVSISLKPLSSPGPAPVLVITFHDDLVALEIHYRDRADRDNVFIEKPMGLGQDDDWSEAVSGDGPTDCARDT